jgi:hypothetical protein
MTAPKPSKKPKKRRPGPVEERLVIAEDPETALKKLFKPKTTKRPPTAKKR